MMVIYDLPNDSNIWIFNCAEKLTITIILNRGIMDKTIKDIQKISSKSYSTLKTLVYYGYVPLVLFLGFRTADLSRLTQG